MLKGAEDVRSRLKLMKGVLAGLLGVLQEAWGDVAPGVDGRTDVELMCPATVAPPWRPQLRTRHTTSANSFMTYVAEAHV